MRAVEASQFRNLVIENVVAGADTDECAPSRASIEFRCDRAIESGESLCVPIAVSEFSLADLIGHPRLLGRIERSDGRTEFWYGLSGPLRSHP
jgi:hypothetical protein